jgi:hypothetical protein
MVRDVWIDGSGNVQTRDNKKQADEFRTIAIINEGEGGISGDSAKKVVVVRDYCFLHGYDIHMGSGCTDMNFALGYTRKMREATAHCTLPTGKGDVKVGNTNNY